MGCPVSVYCCFIGQFVRIALDVKTSYSNRSNERNNKSDSLLYLSFRDVLENETSGIDMRTEIV